MALKSLICIVTPSETIGSVMANAEARRLNNSEIVTYEAGANLLLSLPDSLFDVGTTVVALERSYANVHDLTGIIKACSDTSGSIDLIVCAKKAYKCITEADTLVDVVEAATSTVRGVDEIFAGCDFRASDACVKRIAASQFSQGIVEDLVVNKSPGDIITKEDVARATPEVERYVWNVSSLVFKGASAKDIMDVFHSLRSSGAKPQQVSSYMTSQIRNVSAAVGSRKKKETLLALGVNERAVYPITKSLPKWSDGDVRRAMEIAQQLDVFTKSSASSRVGVDAQWAVVESLCIVASRIGGKGGRTAKKGKGSSAKSRGITRVR